MQIRANTNGILCYEACHALGSAVSLLAAPYQAFHTHLHIHLHINIGPHLVTHHIHFYAHVRIFNWYFEALPLISCIHKVLKLVIVTLNLSAYIHSWILMSGVAIKRHYPIKNDPSRTPLEKPKDLNIKPQVLSAF